MGMAASQARYLALVARKANCEYEGQQINQSRLNLANQTASLFTQMMGLAVPVPPSIQDYMKLQYEFKDGTTTFAITDWKQLSSADSDEYNYLVTYFYEMEEPQGSQKLKSNPQVQFNGTGPTPATDYNQQIRAIEEAQNTIISAQNDYDNAVAYHKSLVDKAKNMSFFADNTTFTNVKSKTEYSSGDEEGYTITRQEITPDGYEVLTYTYTPAGATEPVTENRYLKNGKYYKYDDATEQYTEVTGEPTEEYQAKIESRNYISYNTLASDDDKTIVSTAIDTLKSTGALSQEFKYEDAYYDTVNKALVFYSDIKDVPGTTKILPLYYPSNPPEGKTGIEETKNAIAAAETQMEIAKSALEVAEATFKALDVPTYVGNATLTPICKSELTENQMNDILQIIKDMRNNNIDNNLIRCFDTLSGTYSKDTYTGGIYTFVSNGTTYYTTYYDLANSFVSGESKNNIDGQSKLPTYTSGYIKTRKENTEKALLDTNTEGRFTTIRLENDSIVYPLEATQIKDEVGYEDAMNQYTYNKAVYDKKVADINAQTSIIQKEDQDLELRLKQLDTEQNALNTEIDAVSKVVKDNIEKSFKTFSG